VKFLNPKIAHLWGNFSSNNALIVTAGLGGKCFPVSIVSGKRGGSGLGLHRETGTVKE
jgi:hypothetical protein